MTKQNVKFRFMEGDVVPVSVVARPDRKIVVETYAEDGLIELDLDTALWLAATLEGIVRAWREAEAQEPGP